MRELVVPLNEALKEGTRFRQMKSITERVLFIYNEGPHNRGLYELQGGKESLKKKEGNLILLLTFHEILVEGKPTVEFFTVEGVKIPDIPSLLEAARQFNI